ncbi:MAG: D-alanyl-D-alanine carboxypeptidase [Clostridia bacterium]|nr:D-alanyl-D-alanine carboxypeptidase [Clostridia bacterium]
MNGYTFVCSAAVGTSAQAAVLLETSTNTVLYQKNPNQKLPMASTTKIMTALCAIEAGNIDRTVTVDDSAIGVEGSSIYLAKGERLTVRELIYGLMLHSGNDAAVAIACAVSGSVQEFAQLMNDTAQRIGAVNTHFDNPNGLDSQQHYTTAYDLALITSHALKNKEFAKIVATYTTTISNGDKGYDRQLKNHNKLLKMYDGCTGVKTGYTRRCGRCLVSSAKRGNIELVAVTLNDGNDWQDHMSMLDYGFANTVSKRVLKKGEYIQRIAVSGGNSSYVNAVADEDLYVTLPSGTEGKIQISANVYGEITAPVSYGTVAGDVTVTVDGRQLPKVAAVCDRSVPQKNKSSFLHNLSVLIKVWHHIVVTGA